MMKVSGIGLGVLMLVTGACLAFLGVSKLMWMTNETGHTNYAALFSHCGGPRAGPVLDGMLFVYGCGSCVGDFVFLGDFIPSLIALATGRHEQPYPAFWRDFAILGTAVLLLPLTLRRDTSILRFVAPISILALMYMALVVASKAPLEYHQNVGQPGFGEAAVANVTLDLFQAFAICIFAFNCHINVVPVAEKMVRPTKTRITKVSIQVNLLQLCFYLLIGVTGYLSFLDKTPEDILRGYMPTDPWVAGGRVLLTFTMLVAIVLNLNPTVRSGLQLIDYFRPESPIAMPSPSNSPRRGPARPDAGDEESEKARIARTVLTTVCIFSQAAVAVQVPGVADVLGLLGATVATAMMLIIPAYCMEKVMPKTRMLRVQQAVMLLFAAVAFASVPLKFLKP